MAWADEWRPPPTFWSVPEGYMLMGFLVQLVGGFAGTVTVVGASGADNKALTALGYAVLGIAGFFGGTLFVIGVIAKGVAVGRRQD